VGKVCVITGASQGIGRAAAIRMSREPDVGTVVLIARNAGGLEATAAAMQRDGMQIELIPYDLMDLEGIPDLIRRIHDRYGSIDTLLNIAGYADPQSLLDTEIDNIVKTYTINVFAMLVLIREVARYMYDRPAKILNVASTAGITSRPGWLAYASSKAAVVSLSATLADELAGSGIRIYSISPGRTATELRRKLAPEEDPASIMQPGQVADVIAQLMSDSEITLDGQNIVVRTRASAGG
jgi:3-oxoacyl-[acyl-carrier protein] reductase